MKIRINTYERSLKSGTDYAAVIAIDGKSVLHISNCDSLKDARKQSEDIAERLASGESTLEEIRKERRDRLFERRAKLRGAVPEKEKGYLGKSVIEWADFLGVTRGALYKAARNKKITIEQEIRRRLPPSEWEE